MVEYISGAFHHRLTVEAINDGTEMSLRRALGAEKEVCGAYGLVNGMVDIV